MVIVRDKELIEAIRFYTECKMLMKQLAHKRRIEIGCEIPLLSRDVIKTFGIEHCGLIDGIVSHMAAIHKDELLAKNK